MVVIGIYSTLGLAARLSSKFQGSQVLTLAFVAAFAIVLIIIFIHAFRKGASKSQFSILLGIVLTYFMLFVRMGLPERTHLFEYSAVAVLVHLALLERHAQINRPISPGLVAVIVTIVIGVIDELIQLMLPLRVFDLEDILFNSLAATMAIAAAKVIQWGRSHFGSSKLT